MLGWMKKRRRRAIGAKPIPPPWLDILEKDVSHYGRLADSGRARLRNDMRVLIAEKRWEGCGGLDMNDRIRVVIAAQACVLLLGLEHDFYPHLRTILVYPTAYLSPATAPGFDGIQQPQVRLGEAMYRGPVVLSWADTLAGARREGDGHNLVFHEFAHQLDQQDTAFDGTPRLGSRQQYREWQRVMTREFEQLVERSSLGRATLLDQYGAQNPAEFFAVATECFFEQGTRMARIHPQLYEQIKRFYRQDPTTWRA